MSVAKKYKLDLSEAGIDRLIADLEEHERWITEKTEQFRARVAEEIQNEAAINFAGALMEDRIDGGWRNPNVTVTTSDDGNVTLVIADGEDAVFVEFGAGVYHNGSAGSSPHPMGSELGMTIGSYGKGFGVRKAWGYYDNGELVLTRGTPASMPMYSAAKAVADRLAAIVKEVFGAD